jgi:hypothetical protein
MNTGCQQVPMSANHQLAPPATVAMEKVPIGASPFREAPISTNGTSPALHLVDRWGWMLAQMQGELLPATPALPGRVITAPKPSTPETDAVRQDAELQAAAIWRALAADTEGGSHD